MRFFSHNIGDQPSGASSAAHSSNCPFAKHSPAGHPKASGPTRPVAPHHCHHLMFGLLCFPPWPPWAELCTLIFRSSCFPLRDPIPRCQHKQVAATAGVETMCPLSLPHPQGCDVPSHMASHRCSHSSQQFTKVPTGFFLLSTLHMKKQGQTRGTTLERSRAGPSCPAPVWGPIQPNDLPSLWTSQFLLSQREGPGRERPGREVDASSTYRVRIWG